MKSIKPPAKLKYQNVSGMMLRLTRSLASHCKRKRMKNRDCAMNPNKNHAISALDTSVHHWLSFATSIIPVHMDQIRRAVVKRRA